ncbi:MAG: hypothetical protein O3B64_03280 [bacterium]|nr:hypothetical protein [bacterium]
MVDRNQIDFYDPEETANTSNQVKLSPTMRRYLVIGGGIIIAILLVLFIVNRVQQGKLTRMQLETRMQAGEVEIQLSSNECEGDEACLSRIRTAIARDEGLPELCDGLREVALDNCLSLIAIDLGDRDICKGVSEEAKTICEDTASLEFAISTLNIGACNTITTPELLRSCTGQVENRIVALGACGTYGIDTRLCDADRMANEAYERVLQLRNAAACDELSELSPSACYDLLSSNDFDGDGLVDSAELEIYGTDPRNRDTDGDGYSDHIEIESGFDPLS